MWMETACEFRGTELLNYYLNWNYISNQIKYSSYYDLVYYITMYTRNRVEIEELEI